MKLVPAKRMVLNGLAPKVGIKIAAGIVFRAVKTAIKRASLARALKFPADKFE